MSVRIRRVTTTRAGGVSAPPFDSFNLGDHVGDNPSAVAANRARLAAAIGLPDRVVWMNQVHGDRVEVVDGPRDTAFAVPPAVLVFQKGAGTCKLQALNFGFSRDGHGRGYPDPAFAAKLKTLALAAASRM